MCRPDCGTCECLMTDSGTCIRAGEVVVFEDDCPRVWDRLMSQKREYCISCEHLKVEWPSDSHIQLLCYCEHGCEEICRAKNTTVLCGTNKRFAVRQGQTIEIIEREVLA